MTLSKLLNSGAASLALTFALSSCASLGTSAPPESLAPEDVQAFTCDAAKFKDLSQADLVHEALLPATVLVLATVQSSEQEVTDAPNSTHPSGGPPSAPLSGSRTFQGSGFIIDSHNGYIITNHHVINDANEISINLYDPGAKNSLGKEYEATLLGSDKETDVAVLQITPSENISCVHLADSKTVKVTDEVIAIGSPHRLTFSTTKGVVSAINRYTNNPYTDYIQTDAAINQGSSGGPAFNDNGEVIGINTAILESNSGGNMGISFAVPSNTAKEVATQIIFNGEVKRGRLGINLKPLSDELATKLGLTEPKGALIDYVGPGSPAEQAGLAENDVVQFFNGLRIHDPLDLLAAVGRATIGESVDIKVWRDGHQVQLLVKVGDRNALFDQKEDEEQTLSPKPDLKIPAPL